MFGELVFMTRKDSEAFEKSSSLFQRFSEVYWLADVWKRWIHWFVVQKCPWKFEPLESGKDSVKINLSGTDKTRWRTISTTKASTIWIGEPFRTCWKATLQRLVIKLMNTCYLRVFALFYFVNWDDVHNFLTVSMRNRCNDQLFCGNF